jgi:oxaloacetate decarboxylase alpha subunit
MPDGSLQLDSDSASWRAHTVVRPAEVEVAVGPRSVAIRRGLEATPAAHDDARDDACRASMPGRVAEVVVAAGDTVAVGDVLLVLEAMKLENPIEAPRDGQVAAVHVAVGDQVSVGEELVELVPIDGPEVGP